MLNGYPGRIHRTFHCPVAINASLVSGSNLCLIFLGYAVCVGHINLCDSGLAPRSVLTRRGLQDNLDWRDRSTFIVEEGGW